MNYLRVFLNAWQDNNLVLVSVFDSDENCGPCGFGGHGDFNFFSSKGNYIIPISMWGSGQIDYMCKNDEIPRVEYFDFDSDFKSGKRYRPDQDMNINCEVKK